MANREGEISRALLKDLPQQKEKLQRFIIEETTLRNYFEEELDLKLILNREGRTVYECAERSSENSAVTVRENRESVDTASVHCMTVYHEA
ncbi:MAG: hypothetical protein ACLSHX_05690 [Suilimivivens sp.]